jgi:pilus assembly protein CpaB
MRLGRLLIIVAVVLIIGVVAVGTFFFLQRGTPGPEETPDPTQQALESNTVEILVLLRPVNRGEQITDEVLGDLTYPRDLLLEGTITSDARSEVVGKRAKYYLAQGLYLTERMLSENLVGSDASLEIESGKIAVTIPIDRISSVAYGLQPGDRVDVISTMLFVDLDTDFQTAAPNNTAAVVAPGPNVLLSTEAEGQVNASLQTNTDLSNLTAQIVTGGSVAAQGRAELDPVLQTPLYFVPSEPDQRPRMVSQMLMQNVIVLYVGEFPDPSQTEQTQQAAPTEQVDEEGEAPPEPEIVRPDLITLVVTPQEAVSLNYLMYAEAQLTLALRSNEDAQLDPVFTDAVTLNYLKDLYNIPLPSKLEFGLEPRVDELTSPDSQAQTEEATP